MILRQTQVTAYGPYCFTKDEYYHLGEINFFGDRRVELIGGEIYEVPPQSNIHANGIEAVAENMRAVFAGNYWVRVQMPLDLSPYSVPDPDVAVVVGARKTHTGRENPTDAILVVEVSDSSLRDDRTRKMSMYAAAGIRDYWIVNLVDRQLEVYRDYIADPAQPFGVRYDTTTILRPGDTVSPLAAPTAVIAVADLLP